MELDVHPPVRNTLRKHLGRSQNAYLSSQDRREERLRAACPLAHQLHSLGDLHLDESASSESVHQPFCREHEQRKTGALGHR